MNNLIMNTKEQSVTNTKEIFNRLKRNDEYAVETISKTVQYLGRALAGIINTIDPQEVVIGGGVAEAGEIFLTPLNNEIKNHVFPLIRNNFNVRKALLGNDAGTLGAVYSVMQSQ